MKFISHFPGGASAIASRVRWSRTAILLAVLCGPIGASAASATTIQQKSLSDLVSRSELVFEGKVTSSNVVPGQNGQLPQTCVTFTILDIVIGSHAGNSIVLCFLGGAVGNDAVVVSDLHYPAVGEQGIYLVESTTKAMANPIAGWDQGRFLIENDTTTGAARMMTADRRPILQLAATAAAATPPGVVATADDSAIGVVHGLVHGVGPDSVGAISRESFKKSLRAYGVR